ncbi:MAG: hypothetical protein IIU61_03345, partial [Alistipes sp.]|nr:hypothetical protein [Alistipes sp.]
ALSPKKNEACGSLAFSADKNCLLWGCGNKKYLFSKAFPLHLATARRSSPFIRIKKEQLKNCSFFISVCV